MPAPDAHRFQLASDRFARHERLEALDAFAEGHLWPFHNHPVAGDAPDWRVNAAPIGDVFIAEFASSGFGSRREREEIARAGGGSYAACMLMEGVATIVCEGVETLLRPGDVYVFDSTREFRLGLQSPNRQLVFTMPEDLLKSRVPCADDIHGSILPRERSVSRLFAAYVAAGFQSPDALTASERALFARHAAELLSEGLIAPGEGESHPAARRTVGFMRALHLIERNLADPMLGPERIARDLGISTRSLHRLFGDRRQTVMKEILAARLNRAADLLASSKSWPGSVTEVAFACGFNDASHFSRSFRRRFGCSPREYRNKEGGEA